MQLEDYTTGTVSISNGSATLTGTGTAWSVAGFKAGDTFHAQGLVGIVASIDSDTAITLRDLWTGTTISGGAYLLRYQPDNSRMQGTTRQLLDELRQGIWLTPDATGKTADKATYDTKPAGFRFLDVSVDPFKLYVKETDTSGDWSSGASWVGPEGDDGSPGDPGSSDVVGTSATSLAIATGSKTFTIAETDRGWGVGARLRASSDASAANFMEGVVTAYSGTSLTLSVDLVGGSGTKADWTINLAGEPGAAGADGTDGSDGTNGTDGADGRSIEWQGDWATGTAYEVDDTVANGGSSYICVTAHTAGTFATDLAAGKWDLMAQKGADGTGTGDVVGPSSATDGNVMVADGVTGKKVKDGGKSIANLLNASNLNAGTVPDARLPERLKAISAQGVFTDCDAIKESGFYFVLNTAAHRPVGSTHVYILCIAQTVQGFRQIALDPVSAKAWSRYSFFTPGTWSEWEPLIWTQAEQSTLWTSISDLASTDEGKGASLIGVEDAGGHFDGDTVEEALAELAANAGGSSPVKAWVNFNGTGTPAIRDSVNVSSITDNGTGDYTVNFMSAMPNANYAAVGSAGDGVGSSRQLSVTAITTSSVRVETRIPAGTSTIDPSIVCIAVFGD